jgi:transposase
MEQKTKRKNGHRYSDEFKSRSLHLLRSSGQTKNAIAKDLGIPPCTLALWEIRERNDAMSKATKPVAIRSHLEELEKEVVVLRKENRILQMERDILKKAAAFFAKESELSSPSSQSKEKRGQ